MEQHVGHAAFDHIEVAEPRIAGVEAFYQLDDAVFETGQRVLITLRHLHPVKQLAERMHGVFEIGRNTAAAFRQRCNSRFQPVQQLVATVLLGRALEPGGEAMHLGGQLRQRAVRGHVRADVAHRCNRFLELVKHRRLRTVLRRRAELVDLVRQAAHRVFEADQVFRRREVAQRVAHLGEALLQPGEGSGIAAGLAAAADTLG
jgi:hypothetical protein